MLVKYDDGDKEPTTEEIKNPLTLRHLLTHSSGLVYEYFDPKIQRWHDANWVPKCNARNVPERSTTPLAFQPGKGWLYGTGIDWGGYFVEQASDMQLDEYVRTNILQPLSILSTELSFFPVKEGLGDRMPDLNPKDPGGDGLSTGMGHSVHEEGNTHCFGRHGAYASLEAYIEVLYSIISSDGKLLKSESVQEMFKPQLEPAAKHYLTNVLENPKSGFFGQNTSGSNRDFGLGGLRVGEDGGCGMGEGSLTWGGGVSTAWVLDRKNCVCGIVSLQLGLPANAKIAIKLKEVFRKELKRQLLGSASGCL